MSEYSKEISKIPLLSDLETNMLVYAYKQGDEEARQKLIKHNLRLVLWFAIRYSKCIKLSIDDLINIGCLGLIKAIDLFDETKNVKLSCFASICIEDCFKKHINFSSAKKRSDGVEVSLEQKIFSDEDGNEFTLGDTIEAPNSCVFDIIEENDKCEILENILTNLTEDERKILYLRYGFMDGDTHTLEEISKVFNLTKERIRQKEEIALKKLRKPNVMVQIKDFY